MIICDWRLHALNMHQCESNVSVNEFLPQIMLVDGYKGQKVQDVKKPIQKMMVETVRHSLFLMQKSLPIKNKSYSNYIR